MAGRIAYLGNIVTQGLVLDLDAAIKGSYPGTGSIWTDVSNNNNNGTLVNGPTFSSADYGSIVFDGVDDYVVIPSSTTITPRTGDFCADFWLYPTSYSSLASPVLVTAVTNGIWIGRNASNFVLRAYAVADRIQNPILPATSSWTNVSITRNGTNNIMYYNGAPSATSASNQDFVQGTTYLGNDGIPGPGIVYFNGRIATNKYYNIGLSQFQIWNNFNSYKSRYGIPDIVTDGLVLNLDAGNPYSYLSGSSGTTWANTVAVSSSISGTLVNGPIYSNGAITFDGVDDYVNITNSNVYSLSSNFTFSCWVKIISTPSGIVGIFGTFDDNNVTGSPFSGWSFWLFSTTGLTYFTLITGNGNVAYSTIRSNSTYTLNTWYNLTGVNTGGTTYLYVNGIQQTQTSSAAIIAPTSGSVIGRAYPNTADYYLNGSVASSQIYNRALSQEEITQNFNALRGRYGI